jgi:hydroxypyruvate isomerase
MPRFAANLTFLFTEVPFLDRFAAAARAGFKAVEYMSPYEHPADEIAARLAENGLEQVLFNLPPGDWAGGERGIAVLPDRTEEFRAGVARALGYARTLNCPQVNCLVGIVPAGLDPARAEETLVSNLAYAAGALGAAGIRLLIEPINDVVDIPGFFLTRTRQALAIIDRVGSDNLRVQYDVYHMQVMEGDLARTIAANLKRIGHIQVADNPGRHEPGTGEINYPFLFDHIDRLGYDGWIGCEYRPVETTAAGLGWMPGTTKETRA